MLINDVRNPHSVPGSLCGLKCVSLVIQLTFFFRAAAKAQVELITLTMAQFC